MTKKLEVGSIPDATREADESLPANYWDHVAQESTFWLTEMCELVRRINDPNHTQIERLQMRFRASAALMFCNYNAAASRHARPTLLAVQAVANEVIRQTEKDYWTVQGEISAGASLVSSAPETLEALETLLAAVEHDKVPGIGHATDKARAAIAKARPVS